MPIDPSIPLSVKMAEITPPDVVMARRNALALQQQNLAQGDQQLQEGKIKLDDAAKARAEQEAVNKIYVSSADASGTVDPEKFLSALGQAGLGSKVPAYKKSFDDAAKSAADTAKAKADAKEAANKAALSEADYFGGLFQKIKSSGNDPIIAHSEIEAARAAGHDVSPFESALKQMPLDKVVEMGIQGSKAQRELLQKDAEINKPIPVAGVGLVDPKTHEVLVQAESPSQSENVIYQGKPIQVSYNPKTRKRLAMIDGKEVDVTGQTTPIPPAAMQVAAQVAGQDLPEFATTPNRPTKEDGNKFDTKIGMTPNGLYQAALTAMETGQYPPMGRGQDARAQMLRAAINAKIGAIAADSGMDEPALRAAYKANAASLKTNQQFADAAESFLNTADKNSKLLDEEVAKIPDTGSPLLNAPVRAISQKALGNVDMSKFKTYLSSVQNEYAKILNNPNLAGQLTDTARSEAQHLVSGDATVAQILGSLQALRTEGGNRLTSIGEQIQRIQSRMHTPGGGGAGAAGSSDALPKVGDTFNGGKVLKVEKM